jgi:hypothetical protein
LAKGTAGDKIYFNFQYSSGGSGYSDDNKQGFLTLAGSDYAWYTVEIQGAAASGGNYLLLAANTTNSFFIKEIHVTEAGEVAAYTPKSINDDDGEFTDSKKRWYDTTSNANHGDITGATVVGYSDLLGTQRIKGRSGTRDQDNDGRLVLGHHANHGFLDYCEGTGQGVLSVGNSRDADGAKVQLTVNDSPKFTVTGSGEVKATSYSGGLKQVARTGTSTSIGLIDGDGSKTHFTIQHNLGTELVVVSVREKLTPFSFVEAEVRCGSWSDNSTMASNSQYDNITVIFATAPAATADFYCTVIG